MVPNICSVDGCDGTIKARGWCGRHLHRFYRHGSPCGGHLDKGEGPKFVEVALSSETDDCIEWPFSRHKAGYGALTKDGKTHGVHRLICQLAHGDPPSTSQNDASHICGNHPCVNPRHLRWASHSENMLDKVAHGTDSRGEKHWNSKLTAPDVRKIRRLLSAGETKSVIASKFDVSRGAIEQIKKGATWGWLD